MARNRSRRVRDPVGDSAERLAAATQIQVVLDTLSEREARIISMRFGLIDGERKTLDEIA
jgi:RNA polymerase primary sigma factor